jgi:hypothetical protein
MITLDLLRASLGAPLIVREIRVGGEATAALAQ